MTAPLATSRLRRLAQPPRAGPVAQDTEQCDLCGEAIGPRHRHMLDLDRGAVVCACRACTLLFDHRAAGGRHYRLIPERRRRLDGFRLDDETWAGLELPVDIAFFVRSTPAERVIARYPSPLGAVESALRLEAWTALEAANPELAELAPDVEALLVNRARGAREHWVVPVDDCFRLVALMRTRWNGLSGGDNVWQAIQQFFDDLEKGAR